jgi:hypothetical protein
MLSSLSDLEGPGDIIPISLRTGSMRSRSALDLTTLMVRIAHRVNSQAKARIT